MAIQDQKGAVAVLQVGRVDDDREDQAEGVDQEMALLARDLLARVSARRVDARPCPCRILDPDQTAVQTTEVRDGLDLAISLDRSKEWSVFT